MNDLVDRLARAQIDGPVCNQYALGGEGVPRRANAIRRANLNRYLSRMAELRPALLLVGEAPGYRGCRLTGVPFTSEAILLDGRLRPFGARAGYRKTAEQPQIAKEATATMVWAALDGFWPPPLLWNAFPFHPHQPDRPLSNRRPLRNELRVGASFLRELMALIPVSAVAAVGQSAAVALADAGLSDVHLLRHPSHGGQSAFRAGLALFMTSPVGPE